MISSITRGRSSGMQSRFSFGLSMGEGGMLLGGMSAMLGFLELGQRAGVFSELRARSRDPASRTKEAKNKALRELQ